MAKRCKRPALRSRAERDALVLQWYWLPRKVIKYLRQYLPGVDRQPDDAVQEAYLVMLRCAEIWDPVRDAQFKTYCWRAITNNLRRCPALGPVVMVPGNPGKRYQKQLEAAWQTQGIGEGFDYALIQVGDERVIRVVPKCPGAGTGDDDDEIYRPKGSTEVA